MNNAANQYADKGNYHYYRLHEIGGAFGKEAAENRINKNECSSGNHHRMIRKTEKTGKELSAGYKAACCVNGEKDENEHCRNTENNLFLFMETVAQKVRNCYRVAGNGRVCAQAL